MDFTKFVAMLANKTLHFTRVDKLPGDPFEGLFPDLLRTGAFAPFEKEDRQRYCALRQQDLRRFYYASCWHGNDGEVDAMWKVYVRGNEGIAIRTTVGRLKKALNDAPEKLWIGEVKYPAEHAWKNLPDDPALHACLTKRKCFEHEKEVRTIWLDEGAQRSDREGQDGKEVSCDLSALIEEVRLAPGKRPWFKPVIEDVMGKYNVNAEVVQSELDAAPSRGAPS
jgi:hypothetical protein